jgi:hypothetical protein
LGGLEGGGRLLGPQSLVAPLLIFERELEKLLPLVKIYASIATDDFLRMMWPSKQNND